LSQAEDLFCPWCQTEIVWDPEIGPETSCPHCYNDLGDYRSIQLTVKQTGQSIQFDEDEDEEYHDIDEAELEAMDDEYEEGVQRLLDHQEEAPECTSCQSFMLLAGTRTSPDSFVPFVHQAIKKPLLSASHASQVYVCPSCFKVEHVLAEKDRVAMIELLKQHGKA